MGKDILFGMCADLHNAADYDTSDRIVKFVNEANERGADFIIELGDFISSDESGVRLMEKWNRFNGPSYHVLGNHDTEHNGKEATMKITGQKEKYYSFDCGDYHFIVLDTNYMKYGDEFIDYGLDNYHKDFFNCYIPKEQIEWFREDIAKTDKRCFVFSHAPIVLGDWKVYNVHDFTDAVYLENQKCGYNKVTMVFSGHDHADAHMMMGGVHYMLVNSISHKYVSPNYGKARNVEEAERINGKKFSPVIRYKDPLYAFVRLKENGLIQIIGKQTEYLDISPFELHWERFASPQISYREMWMNGIGENK